jgi:cell division protein FtsX
MLLEGIREAFLQIKAYRYIAFTAIGIMSFILLVFGIFLLSFYNITIFAETLKSDMQVIAYLDYSVPHERVDSIKNEIEDFREVEAVKFISRDYALEMLSKNILSVREIVKELDGNPLPDSFRISLVSDA